MGQARMTWLQKPTLSFLRPSATQPRSGTITYGATSSASCIDTLQRSASIFSEKVVWNLVASAELDSSCRGRSQSVPIFRNDGRNESTVFICFSQSSLPATAATTTGTNDYRNKQLQEQTTTGTNNYRNKQLQEQTTTGTNNYMNKQLQEQTTTGTNNYRNKQLQEQTTTGTNNYRNKPILFRTTYFSLLQRIQLQ